MNSFPTTPQSVRKSSSSLQFQTTAPSQQQPSESIIVSVRIRPLFSIEQQNHTTPVWQAQSGLGGRVRLDPEWSGRVKSSSSLTEGYNYDYVHVGSDNSEVYERSVKTVVQSAMEGLNGTVFAYGQTASGKTFTMTGSEENPGVIPRAVEDVFAYIKETSDQREFLLRVSYLEIYNESIKDLLAPEHSDLRIHEDKQRGVFVSPLREEVVSEPEQVYSVLQRGETNRHISSTDYNTHSSRSHAIFQLVIESREKANNGSPAPSHLERHRATKKSANGGPVRVSYLNLIDLAGSEKASSSADRRREGAFINKSLLTLGTVISRLSAMASNNQSTTSTPSSTPGASPSLTHIPYRDSKLTRLLQPSLQGAAKISVLCTLTPTFTSYEESHSTLKFAARLKKITTQPTVHLLLDSQALLQHYKQEIDFLKTRLGQVELVEKEKENGEMENKRLKEELEQQKILRGALKERIEELTKMILTSNSLRQMGDSTVKDRKAINRHSFLASLPTAPVDWEKESRIWKEKYENLLEEIKEKDDDSSHQIQIEELTKEIQQLKQHNQHLTAEINRLQTASPPLSSPVIDLQNSSLTKESIDPDKYAELMHALQSAQDKIEELKLEKSALEKQLLLTKQNSVTSLPAPLFNMPEVSKTDSSLSEWLAEQEVPPPPLRIQSKPSSPALSMKKQQEYIEPLLVDFQMPDIPVEAPPVPPPKSPNAKILSSLLKKPSEVLNTFEETRQKDDQLIKDLEWNLNKERQLRQSLQSKSHEKISNLETELTIAKAELSVAQLLSDYGAETTTLEQRRTDSLGSNWKHNSSPGADKKFKQ